MPRRPLYLARDFSAKLAKLEQTRSKVEALLMQGHVDRCDVEAVYSGLFIDAFTEFEALVESLFIGLSDGSLKSKTQPVTRIFKVSPKAFTRNVIFEGKSYVDWLPMDERTIPRARRFLNGGIPFSNLTQQEKQELKDAHLLRNALAHKSDTATQRFLASINQQALLPNEKTPAGYLRTHPQGPAGLTHFAVTMNALSVTALKLCS
jgi:hypothetical protein